MEVLEGGHTCQKAGFRGAHECSGLEEAAVRMCFGPLWYLESEYAASPWKRYQESKAPREGLRRRWGRVC